MKRNGKLTGRRKFLKLGLAAGALSTITGFLGGGDENPLHQSGEKVKMLTPEGKLVEVDKAFLERGKENRPISNKELLSWMETGSKEG